MAKVVTPHDEELKSFYDDSLIILEIITRLKEECQPTLNGKRFYTDTQLSEILNVSKRTLQEYRDSGIISFYRLDGKILYSEDDVNEFLKSTYRPKFQ